MLQSFIEESSKRIEIRGTRKKNPVTVPWSKTIGLWTNKITLLQARSEELKHRMFKKIVEPEMKPWVCSQ